MHLYNQFKVSNIGIQSSWSVWFNDLFPLTILTPVLIKAIQITIEANHLIQTINNLMKTRMELEIQPAAYVLSNRKAQYRSRSRESELEPRYIMADLCFLHKLKFLEILGI